MVLGLVVAGTAAAADLPDEDQAAIRASNVAFVKAFLAGDMAGLAALYTEDAVLLPPNAPKTEGREAIQKYFATFPPLETFTLTEEEIGGMGGLAYTVGVYTFSFKGEDGELVKDTGKFLDIKQKQEDGSWLLYRDMFNSDLAVEME
jgi:uncharacterized protein (TIGR02246 family)